MRLSREIWFIASLLCILLPQSFAWGQEHDPDDAEMKLDHVVAYSVGVGFRAYSGKVSGTQSFRTSVPTSELDDLLKSLIVLSDGDGGVSVRLPNDQSRRAQATPSEDSLDFETIGEMLRSLRGDRATLTLSNSARVSGRILSVEVRTVVEETAPVDRTYLSMLDGTKVLTIPLDQVADWEIEDSRTKARIDSGLDQLQANRRPDLSESEERTEVEFELHGDGDRNMSLGWLHSMPIWKPSYRFVDDRLQLWTTVENTNDFAWEDVTLTLVSGHPVAFRSPLYHTRYANRTTVALPLPDLRVPMGLSAAYLEPSSQPANDEDMAMEMMMGDMFGEPSGLGGGMGGGGFGGGAMGGGFGGAAASEARPNLSLVVASSAEVVYETPDRVMGADLRLVFPNVSVASGESRTAPAVNTEIKSNVVSVFVPDVHTHTPLRALEVTNQMAMRLPSGPLTVYANGVLAGDAMLPELAPNIARLVSFGYDAHVHVNFNRNDPQREYAALRADDNERVFRIGEQHRRLWTYRIDNRIDAKRTVIIQHPKPESPWKVVTTEPDRSETEDAFRFRVSLDDLDSTTIEVVESYTKAVSHPYHDVSLPSLARWVEEAVASDDFKNAAERVAKLRRDLEELTTAKAADEKKRELLKSETTRIISLLKELQVSDDELRTRYVEKLKKLEDQIESLDASLDDIRGKIAPIDRALKPQDRKQRKAAANDPFGGAGIGDPFGE